MSNGNNTLNSTLYCNLQCILLKSHSVRRCYEVSISIKKTEVKTRNNTAQTLRMFYGNMMIIDCNLVFDKRDFFAQMFLFPFEIKNNHLYWFLRKLAYQSHLDDIHSYRSWHKQENYRAFSHLSFLTIWLFYDIKRQFSMTWLFSRGLVLKWQLLQKTK